MSVWCLSLLIILLFITIVWGCVLGVHEKVCGCVWCVCVCVCACSLTHAVVLPWRSEDNFVWSVSFLLNVSSRIPDSSLAAGYLYLLSHLAGTLFYISFWDTVSCRGGCRGWFWAPDLPASTSAVLAPPVCSAMPAFMQSCGSSQNNMCAGQASPSRPQSCLSSPGNQAIIIISFCHLPFGDLNPHQIVTGKHFAARDS